MPGELLVRFEPGASASARAAARERVGAKVARKLPVRGLELLKVHGVDAAVTALERRPGVDYAEPNHVLRLASTPDDPRFFRQWGLHNTGRPLHGNTSTRDADIDAPEAWDSLTGSSEVTVAVVDTGVAYRHPDLDGNIWSNPAETVNGVDDDGNGYVDDVRGWDWVGHDSDPDDGHGHGTHVAGIIAAEGDNGIGGAGVSWDASIMPLRVLDTTGAGTTADMVEAVAYARDAGTDVLNASVVDPERSQALADAIAAAPDMLVVVAAGNESADNEDASTPTYPCNYPAENLVCVAATDIDDNLASFSNYGTTAVDLAAPGEDILSTLPAFTSAFAEDFDSWSLGKLTPGGNADWEIESGGGDRAYVSDSANLYYPNNTDMWLRTGSPVDLSGHHDCDLDFRAMVNTEAGYDFFTVDAKVVGGAWTNLTKLSGTGGQQFYSFSLPLTDYEGATAVHFRFRLRSDDRIREDGVSLDNIDVSCPGGSFDSTDYGFQSGTSMAAPHVTGAASLLFAAAPAATGADVRQALLDGVDAKASLDGKTATGGRLNVENALAGVVPIVQYTESAASIDENGAEVTLTVERGGVAGVPVSVDYATGDDTATAGEDYTATSGTLSFAAGETTKTVTVPVTDDTSFEGDETFDVALSAPTGGAFLGPRQHATVTVLEDEPAPELHFAAATGSVDEAAGTADVTVERTGEPDIAVSVDYATSDGTAKDGKDYTATSGTLSFAAGETTKTITVPVTDDDWYEGDETLDLTLSKPGGGAVLGTSTTTTLTVVDDDPMPEIRFTDAAATFDEDDGEVVLDVEISSAPEFPVTVNATSSEGTANVDSDYTRRDVMFTFADYSTTSRVRIPIIDDTTLEDGETFEVTLSSPKGKAVLGTPTTATVTITDDDEPVLRFADATGTVDEDAGTASVTVERGGDPDVPVTVDYATTDDTATAGEDYTATTGTLSFAAGQTKATIDVPVADDSSYEGARTFGVRLSGPTGGAVLGTPATTRMSITEDDVARLAFSWKHRRVTERVGQVELEVVRSGNTDLPVTVDYAADSGTASGADFALEPGTLSFAAGETSKTISVKIANDRRREGAETIGVSLSHTSETGAVGTPSTAVVRIAASDQRPDALISKLRHRGFVGNNVYNTTGRHQTKFRRVHRGRSRNFFVRISNDGNVRNRFVVKGSGTRPGARVHYFSGGHNITRAMRSGRGWRPRLAPHRFRLVRVRVTILRRAGIGTHKPFKVRGIWFGDGRRVDAVKGVVRVLR